MKTLTPYRDTTILAAVRKWWVQTYGETAEFPVDANTGRRPPVTILDLYQSYCEYSLNPKLTLQRLDLNQFAKCLKAAKIMQIDYYWKLLEDWEPKEYEVRRAIASPSYSDFEQFLGRK